MKSFTLAAYPSALVALISLMVASRAVRTATAFVVSPGATTSSSCRSKTALFAAGETEVEKLLRMARELRAQAEESEKQVHDKLADKKAGKENRLGGLLNDLFYDGTKGPDVGKPETAINHKSAVVTKLRSKNPSVDTLEQFVDWMDDRRDVALGNEHVESKGDGKYAAVRSQKDEAEAERLFKLTESLLDALKVIDDEAGSQKKYEKGHLGSGNVSVDLRKRLRQKRRERDEQYLERQKSFVEAQTIKEGKSKYEYHDEFLDDLE